MLQKNPKTSFLIKSVNMIFFNFKDMKNFFTILQEGVYFIVKPLLFMRCIKWYFLDRIFLFIWIVNCFYTNVKNSNVTKIWVKERGKGSIALDKSSTKKTKSFHSKCFWRNLVARRGFDKPIFQYHIHKKNLGNEIWSWC